MGLLQGTDTGMENTSVGGWLIVSAQQTRAAFICIVLMSWRNSGCPPSSQHSPFVLVNRSLILCSQVPSSIERLLIHLHQCKLILLCLDRDKEGPMSYSQTMKHKRKYPEWFLEKINPRNKEKFIKKRLFGLYPLLSCLGCHCVRA